MMQMTTGQTYQTPSGRDGYKIRAGTADVFLVPQEKGIFRRPQHLMTAKAGVTLPGLWYTDENYVTWRLQLEAAEDTQLEIVEGGCTGPLKRKFLVRAQIPYEEILSFEENLIENYISDVITEDVFILKSEQARQEELKKSLDMIQQAAEAETPAAEAQPDPGEPDLEERSPGAQGPGEQDFGEEQPQGGRLRKECRAILTETDRKHLATMILLTIAMAACGIGLMEAAGMLLSPPGAAGMQFSPSGAVRRLFSSHGNAAAWCCLLTAGFLLCRSFLKRTAGATADQVAEERQKERFEKSFRDDVRPEGDDPLEEAVSLLSSFDSARQAAKNFYEAVSALAVAAICLIFLLTRLPQAGIAVGAAAIFISLVVFITKNGVRKKRRSAEAIRRNGEADLRQFLANTGKVRLSGASEHVLSRYYTRIMEAKTAERSAWLGKTAGSFSLQAFIGAAILLMVFLGSAAEPGTVPLAAAGSLVICMKSLTGSQRLADLKDSAQTDGVWQERYGEEAGSKGENPAEKSEVASTSGGANSADEAEVAPEAEEESSADAGAFRSGEEVAAENAGTPLLQLSGADFDYGSRPVLRDVSVALREGEYLGIAGPSGCGKTTLMKILAGILIPQEGTLRYRGAPVTGGSDAVRTHAGIVLQDDQLLHGSIRENVLAGRLDVDQQSFWNAAESALLSDEAAGMPMGYETLISEQAETISAGQKQKILLARALARNPEILLLDEAESDLDEKAQRMIHENIRACVPSGVIVSHHFRSLAKCDRIIVVDGGFIVEEGTPEELIQKKEIFYDLMKRQL